MKRSLAFGIASALVLVGGSAWSANNTSYEPVRKALVFMGGENAAWQPAIATSRPGALVVNDVPAEVGYVKDIDSAFRTPEKPFGTARQLRWTGIGRAAYSFRNVATKAHVARRYGDSATARNAHLVFNMRVLEGLDQGSGLAVQVRTQPTERRSGTPTGRCIREYELDRHDLAGKDLWRTYRIPLSRFRAPTECGPIRDQLDVVEIAFTNEAKGPATVDVADIRLETYPMGKTFAESLSEDLLRSMTLDEKIGQMAQLVHCAGVGAVPVQPADVTRLMIGSLFADSGAPPYDEAGNALPDTPSVWFDVLNAYQRAALATDKAIPILFGIDAVHGVATVPGATIFPQNIGLGATADVGLVEAIARATALEASAIGFRLTFSPTLAVARDERWGRTYESLSELPEVVTRLGAGLTRGYQGTYSRHDRTPLARPGSVLATAKHFGGDGAGTFTDPGPWCTAQPCPAGYSTDRTNSELNEDDLIAIHLLPYLEAISAGVGVVMSSDSRWKGSVVTGNQHLITDLLKRDFDFDGIVVTDYGSWANSIPDDPQASMLQTINAGHDLFMLPSQDGYDVLHRVVQDGVTGGTVSMDRVDDAVRRILQKKFELELFDVPFAQPALRPHVGSAEHHALAREAVQQSLVLLKNRPARQDRSKAVLPLDRRANVYLAGKGANDIGLQAGGWTDVWQGTLGNALPGTTVLAGIQELAQGSIVYSPDASADMTTSQVGVVVVGEYPYAEFCGDVLGKTFFCEFTRVNPPGLIRGLPDVPLPVGLPQPQTMRLSTSSFDYASPFVEATTIPVTIDPVSDLDVITRVCSQMPCVVVLLSGRPLFIEDALRQADAFVAAWLPGAEGAGIADVLYARDGANFSGRLAHTWPRTPRDPKDPSKRSATPELDYVPQNAFVAGHGNLNHVLFPIGYGLSYEAGGWR